MSYKYSTREYGSGLTKGKFHIMETAAGNIRCTPLRDRLLNTGHYGMVGGFFERDKNNTPTASLSMIYEKGARDNWLENKISRGTLFTYMENGITRVGITKILNFNELKAKIGNKDFRTVVGGASLLLKKTQGEWEKIHPKTGPGVENILNFNPTLPQDRTAIGFKGNTVFMVTCSNISLYTMRNFLIYELKLDEAILLDGSGSAQMQCKEVAINGDGRKVYSVVLLRNH